MVLSDEKYERTLKGLLTMTNNKFITKLLRYRNRKLTIIENEQQLSVLSTDNPLSTYSKVVILKYLSDHYGNYRIFYRH